MRTFDTVAGAQMATWGWLHRARAGLVSLALLLSAGMAHAGCAISVIDSGSELTLGQPGTLSSTLDGTLEGDSRTLGVKFEVLMGAATVDGQSGPLFVPVSLSGVAGEPAEVEVALEAQAEGDILVRVTWLDGPDDQAAALTCDGSQVQPHSFDRFFSVVAGAADYDFDIVDGDAQEVVEGELGEPLVVRLSSVSGANVEGIAIEFETDSDDELTLLGGRVLTDADGEAEVLVLGGEPGLAKVTASVVDPHIQVDSLVFHLVIVEDEDGNGDDAVLEIITGDDQTLQVGELSAPLQVQALDADGDPLPSAQVRWQINPGDAGQLLTMLTVTDASGVSSNQVRIRREGEIEVIAQLLDDDGMPVDEVSFELEGRNDALVGARLLLVAGNEQSFAVNANSEPMVVQVVDAAGQALANAEVEWRVEPAAAGRLGMDSTQSDANGRTENRVQALQAGAFSVVAELADGDGPQALVRFSFNAESVPDGSTLRLVDGDNQDLVPGTASAPLVVELRNGQGIAVVGARLRFSTTPEDAGIFDPAVAVTGADGRASTRVVPQLPGGLSVTVTVVGDPRITVTFSLRGGTSFIPGLNPNQQGVAGAIDAACPQLAAGPPPPAGSPAADLLARCSEIVAAAAGRPQDVQEALNQLLPDEAAPQATASLSIRDSQLRNLDVRMDALRGAGRGTGSALSGLQLRTNSGVLPLDLFQSLAQGVADDLEGSGLVSPWGVFLTGTIGRVDRDSTSNNPGFDGDTLSLTGGIDYRFSNWVVAGIALGYDDNGIDLVNDSGSIDTRALTLSLYGSYASESGYYLDGRWAYGQLDFDLARNIRYRLGSNPVDVTATASPEGRSRLLAFTLGRDFNRQRWNLGAYLRGELSRIDLDGYVESIDAQGGAGQGLAIRVDRRELDSRTGTLGLRVGYSSSRSWGVLLPYGRLEWVHEFEDEVPLTIARFVNDPTGTPITFSGEAQDEGYGNVALGFTAVFAQGRSAFVQYERRYAQDNFSRQTFTVGGRFEF